VAGAVLFTLALVSGTGAAALGWSQARRVAGPAQGEDPAALARALRRLPGEDRVAELHRRSMQGSWEHDLAAEVLAAEGQAAKLAAVNLALAEAEHELIEGAGWPRAAMRIALLSAALLALLALAAYLLDGGTVQWPLSILVIGGVSAVTCFEAGRSARRNVAARRRAIDDLVEAVFGDMGTGAAPPRRPSLERGERRAARRRS
jgi:hypothetical protein